MNRITTAYHTEIPDAVWREHGVFHPSDMGCGWHVVKTRQVDGRAQIIEILDGPYLARNRAEHIAEQQGEKRAGAGADQAEIPY